MEFKVKDILAKLEILSKVSPSRVFDGAIDIYQSRGRLVAEIDSIDDSCSASAELSSTVDESFKNNTLVEGKKLIRLLGTADPEGVVGITNTGRYLLVTGPFNAKISIFGSKVRYSHFKLGEDLVLVNKIDNPFDKEDIKIAKLYSNFCLKGNDSKYPYPCVLKKLKCTDTNSLRVYKKDFNFSFPFFLKPDVISVLESLSSAGDYSIETYRGNLSCFVINSIPLKLKYVISADPNLERSWRDVETEDVSSYFSSLPSKIKIIKKELEAIDIVHSSLLGKDNKVSFDIPGNKITISNLEDRVEIPSTVSIEGESIQDEKNVDFTKFYSFCKFYEGETLDILTSPKKDSVMLFDNKKETNVLTALLS